MIKYFIHLIKKSDREDTQMATRVLSIEIGQGLTRVVEMDYKVKNPKIYNCFTFETPQNIVEDGVVTPNELFTSVLKSECAKRQIVTNKVVFSVASSRIARRDVKIPLVKEKQIQEVINASATDFFPIDASQYHLVYSIIEKINTKEEKQYRLNLLAVPNDVSDSYKTFAESCGLTLEALDHVGNGVYQVAKDAYKTGVNVVIKVDEQSGLLTILRDGKIDFQRNIVYGVNEAISIVRESNAYGENISYADAIEVLCGKTAIHRQQKETSNTAKADNKKEDENVVLAETKKRTTAALTSLINVIGRVIDYYVSHNDGVEIEEIALVGLGADFSGLSKLMTNTLGHKVRVFQNVQSANLSKTVEDETLSVSRYVACIGAAMAPLNLLPAEAKQAGKSGLSGTISGGDALKTGKIVLVLGIVVALALSGFAGGRYLLTKAEMNKVEKHIAQMEAAGVEAVYQEYVTVRDLVSRLNGIYDSTRTRNENLVAFIEELEEKMPSSLLVINFSATSQGVSMSIETDSKEAAAEVLMQLRTFESIQVVSSTGLTDNLDEGNPIVAFSVDCTYKSVDSMIEAEKEAE